MAQDRLKKGLQIGSKLRRKPGTSSDRIGIDHREICLLLIGA